MLVFIFAVVPSLVRSVRSSLWPSSDRRSGRAQIVQAEWVGGLLGHLTPILAPLGDNAFSIQFAGRREGLRGVGPRVAWGVVRRPQLVWTAFGC